MKVSNNSIFLDTNIIFSVFIKTHDHVKNEKNIRIYENLKNDNRVKIDSFVTAEVYHTLFKKTSKKICKDNDIKYGNMNTLLKNEVVLGKVNALAKNIFDVIKNDILFEIDYDDMLESIMKYKISSLDYAIACNLEYNIATGDDDLETFIQSRLIRRGIRTRKIILTKIKIKTF